MDKMKKSIIKIVKIRNVMDIFKKSQHMRLEYLLNISLDQIFSEYINTEENKSMGDSLAGLDKLSKKYKETIENLIMYFNKSKI